MEGCCDYMDKCCFGNWYNRNEGSCLKRGVKSVMMGDRKNYDWRKWYVSI